MKASKPRPLCPACCRPRLKGTSYCDECERGLNAFYSAMAKLDKQPEQQYRAERVRRVVA